VNTWFGWIREQADVLGLALGVLSLLVSTVPPLRKAVVWLVDRLLILFGHTRRRYRRWFLGEYGTLRNIYLDRPEELSLERTYVPLSISSRARRIAGRLPAS
jgi:hypothetical protein